MIVLPTSTGCSGYDDYWTAKADIKRAEAARVREDTRHREEIHYIHEANTAKAGPVLAYAFMVLVCSGVVIAIIFFGGEARAKLIAASAAARDVYPNDRGFMPVRVEMLGDTKPRGLVRLLAPNHRDWMTIEHISDHDTGRLLERTTRYDHATRQVSVGMAEVFTPERRLLDARAQRQTLALIAYTVERLGEQDADPRLTRALDTVRAALPGMSQAGQPQLLAGDDDRERALALVDQLVD